MMLLYRLFRYIVLMGVITGASLFILHTKCVPIHAETVQNNTEELFQKLAHTLEQLRTVKVKEYDPDIPITIRPLFTELKHGLRDVILQTLNEKSFHWTSPDEITARVLELLQQHDILLKKPYETPYYTYDRIYDIHISQPAAHSELLVVTTTLWVMCGSDTSFYLLQRVGRTWQLIAAQEANDYEDITGAQKWLEYAISPPDETGQFFVVTANINPWCSSNWQSLRYKAFRIGTTPYHPTILLQREETIYIVGGYTLTVQANGFEVIFSGNPSEYEREIGLEHTTDLHMFSYTIEGDWVREFHLVPEDFLDMWLDLPWEDASKWVNQASLVSVQDWYEQLQDIKGAYWVDYSVVQPCNQNQEAIQMGIKLYLDDDHEPDNELFFMLVREDAWFMLQGFYDVLPGCPDKSHSSNKKTENILTTIVR